MKPFIPQPLDVFKSSIAVVTMAPLAPDAGASGLGEDDACRSHWERGNIASDLVTVASPRWLAWAVSEALSGRIPRTQCYLAPVLTGGGEWSLGRDVHPMPMVFGGADCWPAWPDGAGCDDPDMTDLPEHEALAPRRRVVVEEVILDNFDDLGWPAIRAPGGAA